jgi:amino acid permease
MLTGLATQRPFAPLVFMNSLTFTFPSQWNTSDFITAYINLPSVAALFVGYRLWKHARFWRTSEMDFRPVRHACAAVLIRGVLVAAAQGIPTMEEKEEPKRPPHALRENVWNTLFW